MEIEKQLQAIGRRILEQDNAITSHPSFIVERRKRVYGVDSQFCDNSVRIDKEGNEQLGDDHREDEYTRTGYIDVWVYATACFTRVAAEEYIANKKHDFDELRLFVHSEHNNREWQLVRNYLASHATIGI